VKRVLLLPGAVFAAATIFAGCGAGTSSGGGPTFVSPATSSPVGSPTSSPHATSSPVSTATSSPVGTAPVTTPSPAPGTTAVGATPVPGSTTQPGNTAPVYHPANNGDASQTTGTLLTTYQRPDSAPLAGAQTPDPQPTQTSFDTVTQTTTVTNPGGTFDGNSSNVDFRTIETDQQTAPAPETFSDTVDDYFAFSDTIYTGNFSNLGFTSTDDSGYAVTYTFGSGNGLVDVLPEVAGASFTNNAAATIATSFTNNESSMSTYAADGSYKETVNYPNVNASGPTTTQTVVSNLDGSGSINTPFVGTVFSGNQMFAVSAPSAAGPSGTITETTTQQAEAPSTAAPTVKTTSIPNWIPTGYIGTALATETDTNMGATNLPTAACPVPSSFASTANVLVQTKNAVDPMMGTFETTTTTTYVIPNVGPACVVLDDVQTVYYDYSGQSGFTLFSGTPQQITTVNETVYLTAQQLQSAARKTSSRTQLARTFVGRVAMAQARIATIRRKQRTLRLQYLVTHSVARTRDNRTRGIL